MTLRPLRFLSLVPAFLVTAVLATSTGCDPAAESTEVTPPPPPPSPEVRFDRFLTELRRRIEGGRPISGGGTHYSGDYQVVESKVTPPATADGVYRAKVVIRERSSVTVFTQPTGDEAEETESPLGGMLEQDDEELAQMLSSEGGQRTPLFDSPIQTRDHAETHSYDLAYVDGQWVMRTDFTPGTFLEGAFKISLNRQ